MIVLYYLAPIIFSKMQNAALLAPGLLWAAEKPRRIKFAALAFFLITLALSFFKINGAPIALAASILLLACGLFRMALPFYLPAIVFLLLFQGGLLAFRGTFDPAALAPALSYAFTNLIFVASEEAFLREVLRKKLGSGFFPALLLGLLWGLWHVPFHPTADYAAIQILHAAALSLLIDSVYDVSGLPTAIFLHSLHNALPLAFRAAFSPADHLLFFLGCCVFSFFVTKVTATNSARLYYGRKERQGGYMSLFLAPIHQVMYDKIHYTDDLATALAEKDPSTARALEENFPSIEKEPLEAVIDTGNIHGWLAERVVLAEKRLAFAACALAKKDRAGLMDAVKDFGRREAFSGSAEEAFSLYDSHFLNGMPCDRIHMPEEAEEGVAWRITRDVHGEYYDEAGLYDALIAAWWEGLLEESELNYTRNGNLCTVK